LKFSSGITRGFGSNGSIMLNPGSICKGKTSNFVFNSTDGKNIDYENIASTWGKFWNLRMELLVEKSPQSMLKTELIRDVYSNAKSVKFIIMLKHPVTLNVGLPKSFEWLTHKVTQKNGSVIIQNTVAQMEDNVRYFIDFMTQKKTGVGRQCSMGWLGAVAELYSDLEKESNKSIDIKIVRYEDFGKPLTACQSVYSFIYGSSTSPDYKEADKKICQAYFVPSASKEAETYHG
jgi:hypothetical protein